MKPFPKRTFRHPLQPLWHTLQLLPHAHRVVMLAMGRGISFEFRERLMLTVSAVNRCRYCLYGHRHLALLGELPVDEVNALLGGDIARSPTSEQNALLFARMWAEQEGRVDVAIKAQLVEEYGRATFALIEVAVRLIQLGNLSGNSYDYLLYRLTFGRLGLSERTE